MKCIVKNIVCFMLSGVYGKTGRAGCKMLAFDAVTPVYRLCTYVCHCYFKLPCLCSLLCHSFRCIRGESESQHKESWEGVSKLHYIFAGKLSYGSEVSHPVLAHLGKCRLQAS